MIISRQLKISAVQRIMYFLFYIAHILHFSSLSVQRKILTISLYNLNTNKLTINYFQRNHNYPD